MMVKEYEIWKKYVGPKTNIWEKQQRLLKLTKYKNYCPN